MIGFSLTPGKCDNYSSLAVTMAYYLSPLADLNRWHSLLGSIQQPTLLNKIDDSRRKIVAINSYFDEQCADTQLWMNSVMLI